MAIKNLLAKEFIRTGSNAASKKEVLKEISELAAQAPSLEEFGAQEIYKRLLQREKESTTGFEKGIAIPHCSFEELDEFVLGAVTVPEGVDFDAVDRRPTKLLFFIIGPQSHRNRHVKLLAAISKIIREPEQIDALIKAENSDAFYRKVVSLISFEEEDEATGPKSLLQIYVQQLDFFDEILQLVASDVEGAVAVLDMQSAGSYLNRLPLFSTFWTDTDTQSVRLIHAVMEKSRVNDLIRRIHMIDDRISNEPGVMILVHEINYAAGSLDF